MLAGKNINKFGESMANRQSFLPQIVLLSMVFAIRYLKLLTDENIRIEITQGFDLPI